MVTKLYLGEPADLHQYLPDPAVCMRHNDITVNLQASGSFITGIVSQKFPLYRQKTQSFLKLVLKEDDSISKSSRDLFIFLFGKCADDSRHVTEGDAIAVSGMVVEGCTSSAPNAHSCQLIVDDQEQPDVQLIIVQKGAVIMKNILPPSNSPCPAVNHQSPHRVTRGQVRQEQQDLIQRPSNSPSAQPSTIQRDTNDIVRKSPRISTKHPPSCESPKPHCSKDYSSPNEPQKTISSAQSTSNSTNMPSDIILITNSTCKTNLQSGKSPRKPPETVHSGKPSSGIAQPKNVPSCSSAAQPSFSNAQPSPRKIQPTSSNVQPTSSSGHPSIAQPTSANVQPKMDAKGQRTYEYTSLCDLKVGNVYNVYGVIKFFKPSTKTRGTDYMQIVSLVDPTLHANMNKLKCMLFCRNENQLPAIKQVGDIVRFHRLKVTSYHGELQGQSGPGFSSLVFDGDVDAPLAPQTATSTYTLSVVDLQKVAELRQWQQNTEDALSQRDSLDVPPGNITLETVSSGAYFDLVCQVVSCCRLPEAKVLRVWDGTKIQFPLYMATFDGNEIQTHPILTRRASDLTVDVFVFDEHLPKAAAVKPGDYIKFQNLHAAKYSPGGTGTHQGVFEIDMHTGGEKYGRNLTVVDRNSDTVATLRARLDTCDAFSDVAEEDEEDNSLHISSDTSQLEIYLRGLDNSNNVEPEFPEPKCSPPKRPCTQAQVENGSNSSSLENNRCLVNTATVIIGHGRVRKTKLKEVISLPVPQKYWVSCRVLDFKPKATKPADLLRLYCLQCQFICSIPEEGQVDDDTTRPVELYMENKTQFYSCPKCTKGKVSTRAKTEMEYTYMVQLLLGDDTGWLVAGLWRQHAETFFYDLPPCRILQSDQAFQRIATSLRDLIAGTEKKAKVECCLVSYSSESGPCYQIHDTSLSYPDDDGQV